MNMNTNASVFHKGLSTNTTSSTQPNLNINAKAYESPKRYKKSQNQITSSSGFQKGKIVEVYQDNFVKEIKRVGKYLSSYPYIGMDTEFPGIVYPCPSYSDDFYYRFTKANVDNLKLIQIGITLFSSSGEIPTNTSTWQFNLKFDWEKDEHSQESIQMLSNCGIDFEKLRTKGIEYDLFAEYFFTSGLILNENIKWISFNGFSDFAYLLRIVTNEKLPINETKFEEMLKLYYPNTYDIKYLINNNDLFKGGLNKIASDLSIERTGETHQAGSDSKVTGDVFFALLKLKHISLNDLVNGANVLFGIGGGRDNNETITYTQFANEAEVRMMLINNSKNHYRMYNADQSIFQGY